MTQPKYQVFISSTYMDLIEPRDKVIQTVLSSYNFPVGMEMFSAGDSDQWTVIQSTIDSSDYYVLILGHRYGSVTDEGISYTEKEYDYAREKGIPILAFIMDRDAATKPSEREKDPALQEKLDRFVEKAMENKMCDFWSNPDELSMKVFMALNKAFTSHPQVGWVRGDQVASPKVMEELAELSKENRELKSELERLRKLSDELVPSISIALNNKKLTVNQSMEDKLLELPYLSDLDIKFMELPKIFNLSDIPTDRRHLIDEKEIEKYNEIVREEIEKVKKYNKDLEEAKKVQSQGMEINVDLLNGGKAKGTNICVEIDFPKEIKIYEGAKEDFPLPKIPSLVRTPLDLVEARYAGTDLTNSFKSPSPLWGTSSYSTSPFNYASRHINSVYSDIEGDGKTLSLTCRELLHTRKMECEDKYIIVPEKPGNYEIKISIICEQYPETKTIIVPLVVNDKYIKGM